MRVLTAKGFTLVELVIALLVLSILMVVAGFGARYLFTQTNDASAQAILSRVALAQQAVSRDFERYSPYAVDVQRSLNISGATAPTQSGTAGAPTLTSEFLIAENGASASATGGVPVVSMAVATSGSLGLATLVDGKCLATVTDPQDTGGQTHEVSLDVASCNGLAALQSQSPSTALVSFTPGHSLRNDF